MSPPEYPGGSTDLHRAGKPSIVSAPLVDWFEIPVCDLERAVAFYGAVLEMDLQVQEIQLGYRMAFLLPPGATAGPSGALIETDGYTPAGYKGCRLYFARRDLDAFLARVEEAGGTIAMPARSLDVGPTPTWLAYFRDTEGNLLGLHASSGFYAPPDGA